MAMFVQHGGRGSGRRTRRRPMAEINVTPMVDVMLVLLVIFMVTAPLLTTGVNVDLPKAEAPQIQEPDNKALTVSVSDEGRIFVNEKEVALDKLGAQMTAITQANPEVRIYVRGDTDIQYGRVMEVLGTLYSAGFYKAALITSPHLTSRQK